MRALRIHLTQSSANYKKEETQQNKMTYPLPPFSTIIGAIHNACDFREYHPMNISVQGDYKSMGLETYKDQAFLNTVFDDRNVLVKVSNPDCLSAGYIKVATAMKSQGNSFRYGTTILVHDEKLIQEYRNLKTVNEKIQDEKKNVYTPKVNEMKQKRKDIAALKKTYDKKSDEYKKLEEEDKRIKEELERYVEEFKKYENESYTIPYSMFKTLTTSVKHYEILYDIELYIHIVSDDETLKAIYDNVYNIKSLGRSEDFVNVIDYALVDLREPEDEYRSSYHAYVAAECIDNGDEPAVFSASEGNKHGSKGTKYYLNKDYSIVDNKRKFNKKKVYYISEYVVDDESNNNIVIRNDNGELVYVQGEELKNVYIDNMKDKNLIVQFN